MCNAYFSRAPRLICVGEVHYWIEAKILKEGDITQRNKGFDFFIKEIHKGTDIKKATRRTWNKYRVKVICKYNDNEQNTAKGKLPRKDLEVTVE